MDTKVKAEQEERKENSYMGILYGLAFALGALFGGFLGWIFRPYEAQIPAAIFVIGSAVIGGLLVIVIIVVINYLHETM